MNGYLLDTNVLSELRREQKMHSNVSKWYASIESESLFLSVLTLGEIRKGIEAARKKDAPKAHALESWLRTLTQIFSNQILPINATVAAVWGRFSAIRPVSVVDSLLAATASVHQLVYVTRNVADVEHLPVDVLNPFEKMKSH